MRVLILLLSAFAFVALATPAAAQQGDMPADTAAVEVPDAAEETPDIEADETPDDLAPETPDEPAPQAAATHDWEFALAPTDKAGGASGTVLVTEGDTENAFVIDVTALPQVDALDEPDKDVSTYTVWIVPDKERVNEATMAGVLVIEPDGTGRFEGTTPLDAFGIIVTATPDGAPATISGVPVLTGIPVAELPDATPAEGEAVTPTPGETPAVETPAPPVTPDAPVTPQEGEVEVEVETPAGEIETETDVDVDPGEVETGSDPDPTY